MNTTAKLTLHIPKDIVPILENFKSQGGNLSKLLRDALTQWDYNKKNEAETYYKELAFNVFGGLQSSRRFEL